jgi:hypothetical protein
MLKGDIDVLPNRVLGPRFFPSRTSVSRRRSFATMTSVMMMSTVRMREDGCRPLVRVTAEGSSVPWDHFEDPHCPQWSYASVEPFVFERGAYAREQVISSELLLKLPGTHG